MLRRLQLTIVCLVAMFAASCPGLAWAHGPVRQGLEIDHNISGLRLSTGATPQQKRWQTVGLNPGRTSVAVKVSQCTQAIAPTCGIYLGISDPRHTIRYTTAACYTKAKHCGAVARISFTVTRRGVYYVWFFGSGAMGINVHESVSGNIYPLHCGKYC